MTRIGAGAFRMRRLAATALPTLLFALLVCAASAEAFVVTFDSCGGSEVASYTDVQPDSLIAAPADPWRTNSTFLGWYRDEDLTVTWDFAVDVVSGDITLYARWENVYRVRVVNGYTNKRYAAEGEWVDIRAYSEGYWERFDRWIASTSEVTFADRYRMNTSFRMPARGVTVEARYRDRWDDDFIGIGGGCGTGAGGVAAIGLLPALRGFSRRRRKRESDE